MTLVEKLVMTAMSIIVVVAAVAISFVVVFVNMSAIVDDEQRRDIEEAEAIRRDHATALRARLEAHEDDDTDHRDNAAVRDSAR